MQRFTSQFERAISQNDPEAEDQWELLSLYSIDELLQTLEKISLYDFQAIEYLIILYFSHIDMQIFQNTADVLQIAENSFVKYTTSIGSNVPQLASYYRDLSLKSYYDLHLSSIQQADKDFYLTVYKRCTLVMEHCKMLHKQLTRPNLKQI